MRVVSAANVGVVPSTGALLGSTGKKSLMDSLTQRWGGTVFGTENDVFRQKQQTFLGKIVNSFRQSDNTAQAAIERVSVTKGVVPIVTKEDLKDVPPSMWLPILTEPTIRKHFENGSLYGFGVPVDVLPEGDEYGRIINNGRDDDLAANPGTEIVLKSLVYADDPEWDLEEKRNIRDTREFVREYMLLQLEEGGADPTDYPDGQIGRLR